MIIRTSLLAGALLSIVMIFSTSCKKCKLSEDNTETGMIVTECIIYPKAGYLTSNYNGKLHVTGNHAYANEFEVSFDGGVTRGPVNYSLYSILGSQITVPCEAAINKDVSYNSTLDVYTYSITGETCNNCKNERALENYVLVSNIPDGSSIIYDVNVTQK